MLVVKPRDFEPKISRRVRGMAVMANLPFGRERLWNAVQGKPLPEWAAEFDCMSWAQFFLKYIVSHPAVTCAIPGTGKDGSSSFGRSGRTRFLPQPFVGSGRAARPASRSASLAGR